MKMKSNLFAICKRANHAQLIGVYHDPNYKMAVASDGRILVATKTDYDPKFAGKIVDKYGDEIESKFPNWTMVIPSSLSKYKTEISLDPAMYRRAIKEGKAWRKSQRERGKTFVKIHHKFYADAEIMLLASAYTEKLIGADNRHIMYYRDDDFEKIVLAMPVAAPADIEDDTKHSAFSVPINEDWHPLF